MNKMQKKIIMIAAVLAIALIWSFLYMADNQTASLYAQEDFQRCQEISAQLKTLQEKPRLASDREYLSSETTGLIEKAARSGGISPSSIQRIAPQQPKKIPDTSYKEKPTNVTLRDITLKQLVAMSKNLSKSEDNLIIKSIKLTAPSDKDTGDKWNVELVLSYLIYDPVTE